MNRHLLVLFGLMIMWISPVHASDVVTRAEHQRLSIEMEQRFQRQAWQGVERSYQQMVELGVEPTGYEHMLAADAARERGNLEVYSDRLRSVLAVQHTRGALDRLSQIENFFGHVELNVPRARAFVLRANTPILDPDGQHALEFAVAQLERTGDFAGLLPAGEYILAGRVFTVVPGLSLRLDISRRDRPGNRTATTIQDLPVERGLRSGPLPAATPGSDFTGVDSVEFVDVGTRLESTSPRIREPEGLETRASDSTDQLTSYLSMEDQRASLQLQSAARRKKTGAGIGMGVLSVIGLGSGGYAVWQHTVAAEAHQRYMSASSDGMAVTIWTEEVRPAKRRSYTAVALGGTSLVSGGVILLRTTSQSQIGLGVAPQGVSLQGHW